MAIITVLEHFLLQTKRLVVVMDSQYVYDGLRVSAFKWRTAGWVGQSGPVCNVDLWIRALDLVDRVSATVKWIRVPSHTDIPGNERAASTTSLHDSDMVDDPQNTWENLGLVELETPARPRQCRRLNTPSIDVSARSYLNNPRVSYSSGCHTPVTDSD